MTRADLSPGRQHVKIPVGPLDRLTGRIWCSPCPLFAFFLLPPILSPRTTAQFCFSRLT
jgi:hypothetical protein